MSDLDKLRLEMQKSVTDETTSLYDLFQTGRVRPSDCVFGICPDGECGACVAIKEPGPHYKGNAVRDE